VGTDLAKEDRVGTWSVGHCGQGDGLWGETDEAALYTVCVRPYVEALAVLHRFNGFLEVRGQ
jgi:hypothetical protein